MVNPQQELAQALQRLCRDREYSDLVILGKDDTCHHTHRALVCPRSSYFAEMDDKEGQLSLLDEDPETLRMVIDYFYLLDYETPLNTRPQQPDSDDGASVSTGIEYHETGHDSPVASTLSGPSHFNVGRSKSRTFPSLSDLTIHAVPGYGSGSASAGVPGSQLDRRTGGPVTPTPSPLATENPNLVLHAKMCDAGARYGIRGLRTLALDRFKIQLTRHWNSPEFAEAILVVYNSTQSSDNEMRDAVVNTLDWHKALLDKPEIEAVVCEINGLAFELLKRSQRAEPEYMR